MLVIPVDIVITSCISFVSVQARKLIHSAAPPLPKKSCDFSEPPKILFFAGLSECRFSIPAPESHRSVVSLSLQNHIPSSRSFSCNRLSATKKPAHKCVPTSRKRIDLSLLRWWLHIHVTGFEIQSRNCHLRLSDCRQFKAIQKRRYFPLAYRRRCPAYCRLSNP